ncbi:uncharacterized protein LOC119569899 [Penaeus monodon]|uniref:uncharacterized protein LOC119569899 n=1 Tax=Penaeus monodon TaxID=6687 RepID=UPI0018A7049F|nr:uncharacterized protein LOC119569899 [Penaeus monodon]
MMKFLLVLALAAVAAGDHSLGGHGHFHGHFPPAGQGHFPPVGHGFRPNAFSFPHGVHGFRPAAVHRPVRPVAPVRPVVHQPVPVAPVHRGRSGPVVPQPASSGVPVSVEAPDVAFRLPSHLEITRIIYACMARSFIQIFGVIFAFILS